MSLSFYKFPQIQIIQNQYLNKLYSIIFKNFYLSWEKDFLLWLGTQTDIETTFLDCTVDSPIPDLPISDICIATEFFEHVYEPLQYFDRIHNALRNNGLFVTNISDHKDEFMHVSPNLQTLRNRIRSLPYDVLRENQIFRKNSNDVLL